MTWETHLRVNLSHSQAFILFYSFHNAFQTFCCFACGFVWSFVPAIFLFVVGFVDLFLVDFVVVVFVDFFLAIVVFILNSVHRILCKVVGIIVKIFGAVSIIVVRQPIIIILIVWGVVMSFNQKLNILQWYYNCRTSVYLIVQRA